MLRVFLSHSSQDTELAEEICGDLRCAGYEPWIDKQSIKAGSPIYASIESAALKCHYFVVLLSNAAITSQWVEEEVMNVLWDKLSEKKRKQIIPALKESCELPRKLRNYKYADFRNGYAVGFAQIYSAIDYPPIANRWPDDLLPPDQLVLLERDAKTAEADHIRFACAHTLWSLRPDRTKLILEHALGDWQHYVKRHAEILLDRYY
jgi:hypothetical protein